VSEILPFLSTLITVPNYGNMVNNRSKLFHHWCNIADLVMGNIWAAEKLLGIEVPEDIHDHDDKNTYLEQARKTSEEIIQQNPKCKG
jgi:hypothetical protein